MLDGKPAVEVLFGCFDEALRAAGYIAMSGQIVDATRRRGLGGPSALIGRGAARAAREREAGAARLMRKLLKKQDYAPTVLVTDNEPREPRSA